MLLLARAIRCCARPHGPFLLPLVAASATKFVTIVFVFDVVVGCKNCLFVVVWMTTGMQKLTMVNEKRRLFDVAEFKRAIGYFN